MKHSILVGTDLSAAADDAIVRAESMASRDSVDLTVAHVVSPLLWGVGSQGEHFAHLHDKVVQRVAGLTGRREGSYRVVVERGLPHAVLARLAIASNSLLVVGTHMHHGLGHALMKDVTERVVEQTRGPVLVTRANADSGPILVAVDRPFDLSVALDVAIDEARAAGCALTVAHFIDTGFIHTLAADLLNGGAYAPSPMGLEEPAHATRRVLRAELARRQVSARVVVQEGDKQTLIPALAARERARLVVLGSGQGKHALHHTAALLRHVACSVLVVDSDSTAGLDRDAARPTNASSDSTARDALAHRVEQ